MSLAWYCLYLEGNFFSPKFEIPSGFSGVKIEGKILSVADKYATLCHEKYINTTNFTLNIKIL
jgi:hypothetical protein